MISTMPRLRKDADNDEGGDHVVDKGASTRVELTHCRVCGPLAITLMMPPNGIQEGLNTYTVPCMFF